ncbi:hypothetical protein KDN32_13010 [Nocardioides sp. J2M5]|uniref:hypothetical protein n=1 Tax=Nocardioides palaemonis TaxID=2829810 RepID=UPI001BA98BA6|nr:hypothetical protein [Nocardioides palaemonis]MBS2938657.1 hypothetical protein [Nocardioides palaemonis]
MQTRATADGSTSTTGEGASVATTPVVLDRGTLWERMVARLKGDYVEDGVPRPVRLPFLVDWGFALLIILFVVACWVVFFGWLAHTRV